MLVDNSMSILKKFSTILIIYQLQSVEKINMTNIKNSFMIK